MLKFLAWRLMHGAIVLVIVSVVVFVLIHSTPGGPALLNAPDVGRDQAEILRRQFGLDDPISVQFLRWISNALSGKLGNSYSLGIPVAHVVPRRLVNSMKLVAFALFVAVVTGIPLGVTTAINRNSITDYMLRVLSLAGISIPVFWLGILAIVLFSVVLHWLPPGGMQSSFGDVTFWDRFRHLLLPGIVLGFVVSAEITRYTRSSVVGVLGEDYVRTARAKGLSRRVVLYKHVLRNGLLPVVTLLGLQFPRLVSNAAITEAVFSWPGLGRLGVDAAFQRDYPMMMGVTLVASVLVVISSLVVDILYTVLDPRIRYE